MPAHEIEHVYKINSIADFSFILEEFYRQNQISMFLSVSVLVDKYEQFITEGRHLALGLLDRETNTQVVMRKTAGEVSLIMRKTIWRDT